MVGANTALPGQVEHANVDLDTHLACECMVCDLFEGADHGRIGWRVSILFPGPYPAAGETTMLLCTRCKNDWVDGEWDAPLNNFVIIQVIPV